MKSKLLGLLKSKTFWAWFIVVLVIVIIICLDQKTTNNSSKANNIESDPGTNIIQARLVDTGNLGIENVTKLYEGELTFQNLNDGAQHTYFVCLNDTKDVKLNAIYDLPANYYIKTIPDPSSSPFTAGCNFSLNSSNLGVDISKETQTLDNNLKYKDPEGTFSFVHPSDWKVWITPPQLIDNSYVIFPKFTNIEIQTSDTNIRGKISIKSYDLKKFSDSKSAWDEMWNEPLGNDVVDFGSRKLSRSKVSVKIGGINAQITTYGYDKFYTGTVLTQSVSILAKNQERVFEIDAVYTADQKETVNNIINGLVLN